MYLRIRHCVKTLICHVSLKKNLYRNSELTLTPLINVTSACLDIIGLHIYERKKNELEVRGRARREAAQCRKSEWKVNLLNRNSSRSNGSWRMIRKLYPRTTWRMDLRQLTV